MELAKYISALLYEHDCVIVPGFGGFVCSYHPAEIHPGQHSFHPPSKKILFNSSLQANDGLLVSHVAIKLGISFDEALKLIKEDIHELILNMKSDNRVTLDGVGVLFADPDGNIQFDQDRKNNYLNDAYGLATFVSPPVQRHSKKPLLKQSIIPPVGRSEKRTASPMLKKAAYWSTGVAATFLLFGLIVLNFNRMGDLLQSETSFVPSFGKSSTKTEISKPAETADALYQEQIETYNSDQEFTNIDKESDNETSAIIISEEEVDHLTVYADHSAEEELPAADTETPAAPTVISNQRMYHLVAGSFEQVDNAQVLIEKYTGHGYQPAIIGQAANGYYRVSIAAYIRKDEALTELEKARTMFNPNIWLLRQ
jgi:hypothetical protein